MKHEFIRIYTNLMENNVSHGNFGKKNSNITNI